MTFTIHLLHRTTMERYTLILAGLLGFTSLAQAQNCLPEGITFNTQWQVNDFPNNHPGCTQIQGFLKIGPSDFGDSGGITDLTPLSQITSVGGYLLVEWMLDLEELTGLENLTSIGGYAKFNMNDALTDISALSNLASVGGNLELHANGSLTSVSALSNLTSVGGNLMLIWNGSLTSLEGLGSLTSTGGHLIVRHNFSLTDLQGLEGMVDIGNSVAVEDNNNLVSMNGFAPESVTGAFMVKGNPQLTDLSAASGLTSLGLALNLQDNASLASLEDLSGIASLGAYLRVQNCPLITDLSPLAGIDPSTITQLLLQDLPGVSDCALENICTYLALPDADAIIANNAVGCASEAEVETACVTTSVDDHTAIAGLLMQVFPNPSNGHVQLLADVQGRVDLHVYDLAGRTVHREGTSASAGWTHTLDLGHLLPGAYLLHVQSDQGVATARLIIE